MAEGKKSFVLYTDYLHTVCKLTDAKAGKLFKHLLKYVNDQDPVPPDQIIELVFEPMKQQLKRDLKKYDGAKDTQSASGQMGNLKRWNKDLYDRVIKKELSLVQALEIAKSRVATRPDTTPSPPIGSVAVTDNVIVNVTDTVNEKNKFIYISGERVLLNPSDVALSEGFLQRTEQVLIMLSGINQASLWKEFDAKYTYWEFEDRNHFYAALNKLGKEILTNKKTTPASPFLMDIRK